MAFFSTEMRDIGNHGRVESNTNKSFASSNDKDEDVACRQDAKIEEASDFCLSKSNVVFENVIAHVNLTYNNNDDNIDCNLSPQLACRSGKYDQGLLSPGMTLYSHIIFHHN